MVEIEMCATDPVVESSNMETENTTCPESNDGEADNEDILITLDEVDAANGMRDVRVASIEEKNIIDVADEYVQDASAKTCIAQEGEFQTGVHEEINEIIVINDPEYSTNMHDGDNDESYSSVEEDTASSDLVDKHINDTSKDEGQIVNEIDIRTNEATGDVVVINDTQDSVNIQNDKKELHAPTKEGIFDDMDEYGVESSIKISSAEDKVGISYQYKTDAEETSDLVVINDSQVPTHIHNDEKKPDVQTKEHKVDALVKCKNDIPKNMCISKNGGEVEPTNEPDTEDNYDDVVVINDSQEFTHVLNEKKNELDAQTKEKDILDILGEFENDISGKKHMAEDSDETPPDKSNSNTSASFDDVVMVSDAKDSTFGEEESQNPLHISTDLISEIDQEIMKALSVQLGIGPKRKRGRPKQEKSVGNSLQKSASSFDLFDLGKLTEAATSVGKSYSKPIAKRRGSLDNRERSPCDNMATAMKKTHVQKDDKSRSSEERKSSGSKDKTDDEVVWICFVCAKSFGSQAELMVHQDQCEDDVGDDITTLDLTPTAQSPLNVPPCPPTSHSVTKTGDQTMGPSTSREEPATCNSVPAHKPVPTHLRKVGSDIKALPLGLPSRTKLTMRRRKKFKDIYIPPPRDVYFESLALVPTPKVADICTPRKSVTDEDCQIIDLTIEESPMSHSVGKSPRTLLMSQLSRDGNSGSRRHLSFSQMSPRAQEKSAKHSLPSVSDSSDSSDEETSGKSRGVPSKTALLNIPLTSPLGQRVKQHWRNDNKLPIISNMEQHCKTDSCSLMESLLVSDKTTQMMDKLRNRPPPKVTYKYTKKYLNKWFHKYKFQTSDRKEFEKTFKTGLNRESRIKRKQMKPCRLVLSRLSRKDIKYWTTPRPKPVQQRMFFNAQSQNRFQPRHALQFNLNQRFSANRMFNPYAPVQNRFQQYQPRQVAPRYPSYSAQGSRFPTLLQRQQVTRPGSLLTGGRGPTPQLLVRTVAGERGGMKLEVVPVQEPVPSPVIPPQQHNQKRKQTFQGVRADDNMVICLSSDDEDETPNKAPKKVTSSCSILKKQKIGPASYMRNVEARRKSAQGDGVNPVSTVNVTPVNGRTNQDCASSRVFSKSFQWSTCTMPQLQQTATPMTQVLIAKGQVLHTHPQEVQPTVLHCNDGQKLDGTSVDESDPKSDSEYMDYEVICLDSDSDD